MPLHARSLLLLLTLAVSLALHAKQPTMSTRVFKIPPDFLSCDLPPVPDLPAFDPFAPRSPAPLPPRKIAQEILESVGVSFPEGASARFNPTTSLLSITNTPDNLNLVAAYIESIHQAAPATIAYTLTVIEGPGELIRQANAAASRNTDATGELTTLLGYAKNPGSDVRIVGDAILETKSGNRATTEAVCEHRYASALTMDAKSRSSVTHDVRQIGLKLELDPLLAAMAAPSRQPSAFSFIPRHLRSGRSPSPNPSQAMPANSLSPTSAALTSLRQSPASAAPQSSSASPNPSAPRRRKQTSSGPPF